MNQKQQMTGPVRDKPPCGSCTEKFDGCHGKCPKDERGEYIITMKLCPGSMGMRHFIPFLFVISVLGLGALGIIHPIFWMLLGLELSLYFILDVLFSIKQATNVKEFFALIMLFPIFHIAYGIGSMIGITKLFSKEFQKGNYTNKKI